MVRESTVIWETLTNLVDQGEFIKFKSFSTKVSSISSKFTSSTEPTYKLYHQNEGFAKLR